MIVYPGVTVHTKQEFDARLEEIASIGDGVHVDVADGMYVPNTLLSVAELGRLPADRFFEAHLMVNNPESYFTDCKKAGFKRVIVHPDSLGLQTYAEMLVAQNHAHDLGLEFGLAFKHGQFIELHEDLARFDLLLVMTVVPGFSGGQFVPDQLDEVRKLRAFCPGSKIEVDGHVDDTTIASIADAGATSVVSTSYLSGPDLSIRYSTLKGN